MKNYFNLASPPVNIRKLAIANAGFGTATGEAFLVSVHTVLTGTNVASHCPHRHRSLTHILNLFNTTHLSTSIFNISEFSRFCDEIKEWCADSLYRVRGCGYDLNLTYPPASKYPTLRSGHSPCDNSTTPCLPPLLSSPSVCGGLFSEMTIYTANTSPPWSTSHI